MTKLLNVEPASLRLQLAGPYGTTFRVDFDEAGEPCALADNPPARRREGPLRMHACITTTPTGGTIRMQIREVVAKDGWPAFSYGRRDRRPRNRGRQVG